MGFQNFTCEKEINFGDLSCGQLLHFTKFFDLTVKVMEKMSHEIHYPIEMLVEEGMIPFAAVTTQGNIKKYPKYVDTIRVESVLVDVGTRSFQLQNRYLNSKGGNRYGTINTVHTVIDSSGSAVELPRYVQKQLNDGLNRSSESTQSPQTETLAPENPTRATPDFEREQTVFSPQLEAASALYYEDHFRFITEALESYLLDLGCSLTGLTDGHYPFKPVDWNVRFNEPTSYGETLQVKGWINDSSSELVSVRFEMSNDDVKKLTAAITYGCFDSAGDRIPFPDSIVTSVDS